MGCLFQHECTKLGKRVEESGAWFVEDIDSVRQKHQAATVSTYGIRRSRTNNYKKQEADDASCSGKENKVGITYSKGVKLVLVYTGLSS